MRHQIATRSRALVDLSVLSGPDLRKLGDSAVPHALWDLLGAEQEEEEPYARFDNDCGTTAPG
ncbi:hypothetical protein [Nonomuraea sp. NPDC050643]|uniref:hypothetical protein n=1 Tax=Nonomuraea sp. NPDC050643 TaxID=3155660 RepID=UPI0033DFB658